MRVAAPVLVSATAAGFLFWRHAMVMAWIVAAVGAWMLVSALLLPRAFAAVERAMKAFGRAAGLAVTWVLMAGVYFCCFTPLSWMLGRKARTLLAIGHDKDKASYWNDRAPVTDPEHFTRQY
jgi:hypothetical protein